jgi:putative oxidoreductase
MRIADACDDGPTFSVAPGVYSHILKNEGAPMNWHFMIDTLARLCIVYTFFKSGVKNSLNPQPVIGMIASKKWPFPKLIYTCTIILLLAAPLMIITHFYDGLAALGLIGFTLLSNIFFCTYWKMTGNGKPMTQFLFDANIAIIGGLIFLVYQQNA